MHRAPSFRTNRVATEIKRVLSEFLLTHSFRDTIDGVDPRFISITDVIVSPCLRHAKIFVMTLDSNMSIQDCLSFLQINYGELRHYISIKVRLKFTPELLFFEDNSFEYGNNIDHLLDVARSRSSL